MTISFYDYMYNGFEWHTEAIYKTIFDGDYKQYLDKFPIQEVFQQVLIEKEITKEDVMFFVDRGLDINAVSSMYLPYEKHDVMLYAHTPLTLSCYLFQIGKAKILVECGADINQPNGNGDVPLIVLFFRITQLEQYVIVLLEMYMKQLFEMGAVMPKNPCKMIDNYNFVKYLVSESIYLYELLVDES